MTVNMADYGLKPFIGLDLHECEIDVSTLSLFMHCRVIGSISSIDLCCELRMYRVGKKRDIHENVRCFELHHG